MNTKNKIDAISLQLDVNDQLNFKSIELQNKITTLDLFHLHNESEDIFIEFLIKNKALLQRPLESIQIEKNEDDRETSVVTINSSEAPFLKIYTGTHLANLIGFLFENYIGSPIDQLIKSLKVPSLEELSLIFDQLNEQKELSIFLYDVAVKKINQLITKQVISH